MRSGGGQAKGSAFERQTCRDLSLWVSGGARADLFSRNVLSGGRFTIAARMRSELSQPGDMAPAHPLAFAFTSVFMVECKHWRDLHLARAIVTPERSPLAQVVNKAAGEAQTAGLQWLVIAKQNNLPTLVIMPSNVMDMLHGILLRRRRGPVNFIAHELFGIGAVTTLACLCTVSAKAFLNTARYN